MSDEQDPTPVGINPAIAQHLVENQISEPKSSQGLFDLPCGYVDEQGNVHTEIKVREITGHEEDMLANPKIPAEKKMNELITRCVERVGNIEDKATLSKVVMDMMVGDRLFAIFAIRRVTVGDMYTYEVACKECKAKFRPTLDLSDLDIKKMEDPTLKEFRVILPRSKKEVVLVPMTGRTEARLSKMSKNTTDTLSLALMARLTEIDGEPATLAKVKDLSLRERQFIRSCFEKFEGGVDTEVEIDCPSCYTTFKQDLDAGQASFFFPTETQES